MPAQHVRLSDAIDRYVEHRRVTVKPNTVRNDVCFLQKFLQESGNIYVRSLTARHVDNFFAANPGWSVSTTNLVTTCLKTFFRYCRRQRWMDKDADPAYDYRTRRKPQKDYLRIPVSEFSSLLDAAEHPRNRMIIALGLFLFLRASEIRLLRCRDVDLAQAEIAVQVPKSDMADVMVINQQLDRELRRYETWYTEKHGGMRPDWYLIPAKNSLGWRQNPETGLLMPDTKSGHVRLRPSCPITNPERVVHEVLQKLGYPTYWTGIHTLRRSGARAFYDELCERKGDNSALEIISTMLHHKNLTTTQVYLGVTESRKRRDRAVLEGPMFPSLDSHGSGNVIPLIVEAPRG